VSNGRIKFVLVTEWKHLPTNQSPTTWRAERLSTALHFYFLYSSYNSNCSALTGDPHLGRKLQFYSKTKKDVIKVKKKRDSTFLKSTTTDLQWQYFVGEKQKTVSIHGNNEGSKKCSSAL
jgi:hypothetical protein